MPHRIVRPNTTSRSSGAAFATTSAPLVENGLQSTRDDEIARPLPLRPRQLEILTLLALEPDGFSPERLRAAL
ncbi:hypothetical protein ABT116_43260, partial [Streptomyces sp. NPDC002130]|uniref:hypothetical protein n=1 Tax=Streptomyces sp. NPDC002130 TaxID=3155568 RepID=UPI003329E065